MKKAALMFVMVVVAACNREDKGMSDLVPPVEQHHRHCPGCSTADLPDMTLLVVNGDPTPADLSTPLDFATAAAPDFSGAADMCLSPDMTCIPAAYTPTVQLLIDRSGSMTTKDGTNTLSRWQLVKYALTDASAGVLTALQTEAYFGATLFSGGSGSHPVCPSLTSTGVPALNAAAAVASLLTNNAPGGNTPTAVSLHQTADYVDSLGIPAGQKFIVLATDGLPNTCSSQSDDTANTVLAAQYAYGLGITVYVLGVGPDTSDANLQAVANAGQGVASGAVFYKGSAPSDLTQSFNDIIYQARGCNTQ